MKQCDCPAWEQNIDQLDAVFDWARIHGVEYQGLIFFYCPWCGKSLKEDEKKLPKGERGEENH